MVGYGELYKNRERDQKRHIPVLPVTDHVMFCITRGLSPYDSI